VIILRFCNKTIRTCRHVNIISQLSKAHLVKFYIFL